MPKFLLLSKVLGFFQSTFSLFIIDVNINHTKAINAKVVNLANVNLSHILSLNQCWLQTMFHLNVVCGCI